MALEDYRSDMETCCRCSTCKFIPLEQVKGYQYANGCPSISKYNFHAYSGGGRITLALAILEKRLEVTDKVLEIIYNCQMCGSCDVSCKYAMDMEVLEPINEMRISCVENGHTVPILDKVIGNLRNNGTLVPMNNQNRGQWAEGVVVKDFTEQKTKIVYHAGCRTCFDNEMWKVARASVTLLQKAGVDIGIAREHESCCGGRAYQMGYKEEFIRQAKHNMKLFTESEVETLITGCADCYHAFKVLYDKFNMKGDLEVVHAVEYFDRLIKEGKIKPTRKMAAKVTYHDPCHLGRQGEPYLQWVGEKIPGLMRRFNPPKEFRRGTYGVYAPPRAVLKSIPGLELIEMDRTKEYAWCCGVGGGVKETNPEFAEWTAVQRIQEAGSTGAEAIVTACPGCERLFKDTIKANGIGIEVYDVVELLEQSI